MSDTPRTDAVSYGASYAGVAGDLQRLAATLERELAAARAEQHAEVVRLLDKSEGDMDLLRFLLEQHKP